MKFEEAFGRIGKPLRTQAHLVGNPSGVKLNSFADAIDACARVGFRLGKTGEVNELYRLRRMRINCLDGNGTDQGGLVLYITEDEWGKSPATT